MNCQIFHAERKIQIIINLNLLQKSSRKNPENTCAVHLNHLEEKGKYFRFYTPKNVIFVHIYCLKSLWTSSIGLILIYFQFFIFTFNCEV